MDFHNLPNDEKILCLLNIFPDVDPIVINSLIENNLDYDNLIISLLEISDPNFKEDKNIIYPDDLYNNRTSNIFTSNQSNTNIYPTLNEDKVLDDQYTRYNYQQNYNTSLREKKIKESAIDKLKSIKNKITDFVQSKKKINRSEYSFVPTDDWEEDDDDVVVYDRSKNQKPKDFYDDYL